MGYAYQTNGTPVGPKISGLEFSPINTTRNFTGQPVSTIAHSGLSASSIGVKIEEGIGDGWKAIGRFDTGFSPLTGELSDACASFVRNAGKPFAQQSSSGDSSRCGEAFNGSAFAGVTNATYGTLTLGRQGSLQNDGIGQYDPLQLSYAFSLFGVSGTHGGSGSTQAGRWNNSAKYIYQYGPVHAAAMYTNGGQDSGVLGNAYGFNIGGSYRGFSIDAIYTKENGAVNLSAANLDKPGQPLAATISDNESWSIMGKYTHSLGGGGFKDEDPASKVSVYGGYTYVTQANPKDKVEAGATTNGGYAITPNLDGFTTDKIVQFIWAGAKYELPSGWSFTGAYYRQVQNSFVAGHVACTAGGASRSQCAGDYDQGSFVVDYQFNKHLDIYSGVTYGKVNNGLASGFPGTPNVPAGFGTSGTATSVDTAVFMSGMRLKF